MDLEIEEKKSFLCSKDTERRYIWDNYIMKPVLFAILLVFGIVTFHFLNGYILLQFSASMNYKTYNTSNGCPLATEIECNESVRLSIYFNMDYRILSLYSLYFTLFLIVIIGFFIVTIGAILLCYEKTKKDKTLYLINELPEVPKMNSVILENEEKDQQQQQQQSGKAIAMEFDFDSDSDISENEKDFHLAEK